jgi:uncharacterized repeat protein (TIGR01451 family)
MMNHIDTRIRVCLLFMLGLLLCLLGSSQAHAAQRALAQRFSLNAAGDIVFASNITSHCSTATTATGSANCVNARNGVGNRTNNQHTMIDVDVDSNASTFNSSSSQLIMPAGSTVAFAGLYWAGVSTAANRNVVLLATPSSPSYASVTATTIDDAGGTSTEDYQAFADVTSIVAAAGVGNYTVANIQTGINATNLNSGWSLVVVYRNASLPTRNMVVYDGYQRLAGTGSVNINLSGFTTPLAGPVTNKLGVIGYDGDRANTEGTAGLRFGQTLATLSPVFNTLNPQTDVFNSTLSALNNPVTTTQPSYANTLGYDADIFQVNTPLPNNVNTAVVQVSSSGETIDVGVVTLVTDIFVPNIKDSFIKSARDVNGGLLLPGDIIEYTLIFRNTGNDAATRTLVLDAIPPDTSYVPGSIVLNATATGIPTGPRTDAASDDSAEFIAAQNAVVARLGRTATTSLGGQLNPGDQQTLSFRVSVNANVPGDTVINNFATVSFRALALGTDFTDISDSDASTPGNQSATLIVASSDLVITKAHSPPVFLQGQNAPTPQFTIAVSNNGAATTAGTVTVTDLLPAGLSATSITGVGWTCNLGSLSCTRTDALAPAASYPTITLVVSAPNAGTFTNTASVSCACEGAPRTGNNIATDTVVVSAAVSLSITKTNTVTTVLAGQTTSYDITVENSGPSAADNAVIRDTPSAGLACTTVSCTSLSGGAVCPAGPISFPALQAGLTIPTFPANSSLRFSVQCGITADGL